MTDKPEVIQYRTVGTCCQLMQVAIQDGKVVDAELPVLNEMLLNQRFILVQKGKKNY